MNIRLSAVMTSAGHRSTRVGPSAFAGRTKQRCEHGLAFLSFLAGCFLLSPAARGQTVLFTFDGDTGDRLGRSVSGAGDVNGDGFADVIVCSLHNYTRVFSGSDGSILFTFFGDSSTDFFGFSVSGAGDVDGDGSPDFIAGAPFDDNNGNSSGSARVFSGTDGSILFTLNGDSFLDEFGRSVSSAGDVNGDGFADVIVAAPGDSDDGIASGSARVFSGVDGSVLFTFFGDSADDLFGTSLSGAGDVNGDGFADLIVGASHDDNNGNASGSARVFSGTDGSVLFTFNGDSADDLFGFSVSGAGDVDGDGFADLIVGALNSEDNMSGSARVFSGFDGSILFTIHGDCFTDGLGISVSGAGDVDGDGFADVVVGAPHVDDNGIQSGSAHVYTAQMVGDSPIGDGSSVGEDTLIGDDVTIGDNVTIGDGASIGEDTVIGDDVAVGDDVTIGDSTNIGEDVNIGEGANVGDGANIEEDANIMEGATCGGSGSTVGENSLIGFQSSVGENSPLGENTVIGSGSTIGDDSPIGENCTIGSNVTIGNQVTIGGSVTVGSSVIVGNGADIGAGATIASGITIGDCATIEEGAIVTENVPAGSPCPPSG